MVSQSSGQQDSPGEPWEGVSDDSGDIDNSLGLLDTDFPPCLSDVRFTRHKAAWINPQDTQPQLQDLPLQEPTVGNVGGNFVGGAASPRGASPLPLENSVVETSWKDTGSSVGSSGAVQVNGRSISLNSCSPEGFLLPVDVEKENAHFYAADMMISAMEKMKCNILSQQHTENWSLEEASGSLGDDQGDSEVTFYTNRKQECGPSTFSDNGYEGCAVLQVSPVAKTPTDCDVAKEACTCDSDKFALVELGEFSNNTETCGYSCSSSKSVINEPNSSSAELIAKQLYQVFRKCWMLSEVNYQLAVSLNASGSIVLELWFPKPTVYNGRAFGKVVNEERVRKDFESSVDLGEQIKFKSRIRGTEDWAPPRFQVIFNVHPPLKRDHVVAAQKCFCAGCGTPVEPKFVKRLRYCEYLGRYFCESCHSYAESCIPARILTMWDFRKYYVSNFSKRLLETIRHQPIFNLPNVSHSRYAKAKELDRVREIQEQLFHVKKLLKTCRFAESVLKEFEQVPGHLTEELSLFSLEDLVRVKKGLLAPLLKDILKAALAHVAGCELCQGKGFICEFCRSTAVIFPFQTTACRRCSECRACFHKQCFQSSECPRCARVTARRRLLESLPAAATGCP